MTTITAQPTKKLTDPWGITDAQAQTALTFGQQFVNGQFDLQALGLL